MNKRIVIILIVVVIALLAGAGVWKWKNDKKKKIPQQINEIRLKNKNVQLALESKDIIQQLKIVFFESSENTDTQIRENKCFSWIREDGIDFGPLGAWEVSSGRPNRSQVQEDIIKISNLFTQNGFIKNDRNYENFSNIYGMPGEKIGFEKDNLKCNITWVENALSENDPRTEHFEISCVKTTPESEKDFQDIYDTLNNYYRSQSGYTTLDNIKKFCITKKDANFAIGLVGKISAPTWYAKNENGKWVVTMIAQDYPLCDRIKGFPTDYYGGKCLYTDKNGKIQIKE